MLSNLPKRPAPITPTTCVFISFFLSLIFFNSFFIVRLLFKSFFSVLKERKIISTLAAFIGGGVASAEFAQHILVNHYHFPPQTVDIVIITLSAAMLCTLFWLLFRGIRKPRKVKLEFILIPLVILVAVILVVRSFKEMGREGEKAALGMRWKYSIASNSHDSWSEKYDRTLEDAKKRLAGLKSQ